MRKAPANHTIYFASTTQLRSSKNYDLECLDHDTTGFYAPSMAHNALPSVPCWGIVVGGHNLTASKLLRKAQYIGMLAGAFLGCEIN